MSDNLLLLTILSIHHKTKTTPSQFTKTIENQRTSFKQHVEDLTYKHHPTNVHEANKHFTKAILDAHTPFMPNKNENSTNCTHLHTARSFNTLITL